uniref:Non-structural maintenance of chromosomes element 1 homolog n=1 Tax=Leptobrachium leishanense TaxID=445787 RepID=A0A8C5QZH9_9ANUR
MASPITDSHRRFLQVLMSHGIMEGSAARALHKHCCELHKVHYMPDKLDEFIDALNKHLQPVFMQIQKGVGEHDGKRYYTLVNLAENDITKMASDYTENELELFKKTLEFIIVAENGFAPSTLILNLADQLQSKKMKKKEVEQLLQRFVQDKWLIERDGEYTLHTRCIMEMDHYLRNTYQELVRVCNICHGVAIQNQLCQSCGIAVHVPCMGKYLKGHTSPQCPNCKGQWDHEVPNLQQHDSQRPSSSSSQNDHVQTPNRRPARTVTLRTRR